MPSESEIIQALRSVKDPELNVDLVTLKMVRDISISGGEVSFKIVLTTPACPLKDQVQREAEAAVKSIPGVRKVTIAFGAEVVKDSRLNARGLPEGVKNILAVSSGKGGVGKSTVAVNLAVALAKTGARVGILDSDVYGPNVPVMLGERGEPAASADGKKMIPVSVHGVKFISIGLMIPEGKPLIWRGPMLHGVIQQFLKDVEWGEVDYLVVDMPPGTGDAQLTLVQMVPLSGAVIVTTPQEVSLSDVRRSIAMFQQVNVPILGIVENMAGYTCPKCETHVDVFRAGGAEKLARDFNVPVLGRIPLDPSICEGGDAGIPLTVAAPQSPQARIFHEMAQKVAAAISVQRAEELQAV